MSFLGVNQSVDGHFRDPICTTFGVKRRFPIVLTTLHSITYVDWPASSPDLHPIEEVWFYTSEMLELRWCDMRDAGKEAQLRVRTAITDVWGQTVYKKLHRGSVIARRINQNFFMTESGIINSEGRLYRFLLYKMPSFFMSCGAGKQGPCR